MDDPSLIYPSKTLTDMLTSPGTPPTAQVIPQEHHGKEINTAYGTGFLTLDAKVQTSLRTSEDKTSKHCC